MVGFIMAIVLSHISHGWYGGVVESLMIFFPVIIGYYMIINAVDSTEKINNFIILIILLSSFLAYEGCLQFQTGSSDGGMTPIIENNINTATGAIDEIIRIRWFGVFNDPNDLGLALVLVLPFLLNMLLNKKYVLPVISLPLIMSAIYFTNSRGSVLAGVAGIFAYCVFRYKSKTGAILGAVIAILLFALGPSRMGELSVTESSAYERLEAWDAGFQMFKANALFGVGMGMFTEFNDLTAHNSYMLVLAELGLFGTFCFVGLIYYPIKWTWHNLLFSRDVELDDTERGVLCAIAGSLSGLLVAMFFLSRSYILLPFMLIALFMATVKAIDSKSVIPQASLGKDLKEIFLLTLLITAFINILIKLLL